VSSPSALRPGARVLWGALLAVLCLVAHPALAASKVALPPVTS